jgi:hypothetical protein
VIIAPLTLLKAAVDELVAIIELIGVLDQAHATAGSGDGGAKPGARKLLEATALIVDGMLTAYAATVNDPDLLALVNNEKSDLKAKPDQDLLTYTANLLGKAQGLVALTPNPAEGAGLSVSIVGTLEARRTAFNTLLNRPGSLQDQETAVGKLLDAEFKKADVLLDLRLDKLMRQFSETQAALYTTYEQARLIHDPATHGKAAEAPASTAATTPPAPAK